nr:transposase [Bradyrhizobium brasilense]
MRKGFASLSLQVQEVSRRDPLSGHLFCFPRAPRRFIEGDMS